MRAKSWLLLVIALGCGLVASVGISQVVMENRGTQVAAPTVEILVVSKDVPHATKMDAEYFRLESWPQDRVPQGAMTDIALVEGKYTNQRMYAGEPILERKLMASDTRTILPDGFRIFDLSINETTGAVDYIQPGDHVDVYGYFEEGRGVPETKTMKVMQNVEVLMVDGNSVREEKSENGGNRARTVQLLIRDSQFEALNTASHLGKLKIGLRSASSRNSNGLETDNGEAFLDWLGNSDVAPQSVAQTPAPANTFINSMVQPKQNSGSKKEMLVFTQDGLKKYQWSDESPVPQLVDETEESAPSSQASSGFSSGNMVWDPATGKWTVGGMEPQYPAGDKDSDSAPEGAEMLPPGGSEEE